MSSSQMPTPKLESYIESLSGIAVAAFLKTVDPNGSLDLADLQMQEQSFDTHLGTGILCLRFDNPAGMPGYLVVSTSPDPANSNPLEKGQEADVLLRGFAQELANAGNIRLPIFRQCRLVEEEEARREMSLGPGEGCIVKFVATMAAHGSLEVAFFLNPALCAAVEQAAPVRPSASDAYKVQKAVSMVPTQAPLPPPPGNIDLIMDIELDITVSFGNARMLLKDVMQLGTGSLVELDRAADERVDLWVNNKRVARGEIVLVGGNYGVRISEVDALVERINTLAG
jgi:flagellar motor switch protein FliN